MTAKTNYFENNLTDVIYRGQGLTVGTSKLCWCATATAITPPTFYVGLLNVSLRTNSAAVSTGVFIILADSSAVLHLLKCTTAGTTAASPPSVAIANNGTVTDGTVTWTDQYDVLEAGTQGSLPSEFTGGTYARQAMTLSLTGMAGTQSAGSTTASTGTNATTSNNAVITFNGGTGGNAGLFAIYDAVTAGNMLEYAILTGAPVPIASGATVTFAAGALTIQDDN